MSLLRDLRIHARRLGAAVTLILPALGAACSGAPDGATTSDSAIEAAPGSPAVAFARFTPHLDALRGILESGAPADQVAEQMVGSGRNATFHLQALCRLYAKAYPSFDELLTDFKSLEDGIGEYGKWYSIHRAAVLEGVDASTLTRLEAQKADALLRFTQLLVDRQWLTKDAAAPSRLRTIEALLRGFDWKTRAEDRRLVLDRVRHEAKDVAKTTYDMTILEQGHGVHELRRDLRWLLYEQRVLHGLVVLKDDACPIAAYASVPADDYYSVLPPSADEPNPCTLSACLVHAAAKAVAELGDIKDQAETEIHTGSGGDLVPARLQPAAKAIYEEITRTGLMSVYVDQLTACRDAVVAP